MKGSEKGVVPGDEPKAHGGWALGSRNLADRTDERSVLGEQALCSGDSSSHPAEKLLSNLRAKYCHRSRDVPYEDLLILEFVAITAFFLNLRSFWWDNCISSICLVWVGFYNPSL